MKLLLVAVATMVLSIAVPVQTFGKEVKNSSPSFNCAHARTLAEQTICRIPTLGAKDRAIASLYPRVVAATPVAQRRALASDQALFNRSRELCYTPEQDQDDCLDAIMTARVAVLNSMLRSGFR